VRKAVAEIALTEEGVGSPDGRSHAELWMDFAAGVGGSERDLQSRKASERDAGADREFPSHRA